MNLMFTVISTSPTVVPFTYNKLNEQGSKAHVYFYKIIALMQFTIVVPTKRDSDVKLCLQLLSKTLTCSLHLSKRESIDHLCINPILRIGLIHK